MDTNNKNESKSCRTSQNFTVYAKLVNLGNLRTRTQKGKDRNAL